MDYVIENPEKYRKQSRYKDIRDFKWKVCVICDRSAWIHRTGKTCGALDCKRRVTWPQNFKECCVCGSEFYSTDKRFVTCGNVCGSKTQSFTKNQADSFRVLIEGGVSVKPSCKIVGINFQKRHEAAEAAGFDLNEVLAWRTSNRKDRKEKEKAEKLALERRLLAKALILNRSGVNLSEAFESVWNGKLSGKSVHNHIRSHCKLYQKISRNRRERSKYVRLEKEVGKRSKKFKMESYFRDYLCQLYNGTSEVKMEGTGRRCDVLAYIDGVRYAIECKVTTRTTKIDEAIGQAFMSAWLLKAKPAIAFPDDCYIDPVTYEFAKANGVMVIHKGSIKKRLPACNLSRSEWWNGMEDVWRDIKGTDKANPEYMLEIGFNKQQISSILGMPIEGIGCRFLLNNEGKAG